MFFHIKINILLIIVKKLQAYKFRNKNIKNIVLPINETIAQQGKWQNKLNN